MYMLREESELLEEDRIMRWQISAEVLEEFTKSISLENIDTTLEKIDLVLNSAQETKLDSYKFVNGSSTDVSNSASLYKKYEKQIDKLKEENDKLVNRNKELEDAWRCSSEMKK